MDTIQLIIILGFLALFAHIIKGLTGFGPAIIFVSIGSMIHNPLEIIILASFLDIVGGGYLSVLNKHFLQNKNYWFPMGLTMITGAVLGALTLYLLPPDIFKYLLGLSIILIAIWFIFKNVEPNNKSENKNHINFIDGFVGIFSGFCGGFTGMGGPPLIIYLGSKLKKDLFRSIIVPIFLMASMARFSTYGALGMIDTSSLFLYIIPPIGVIIGNHIGNKYFKHVEQKWFTILIGVILLLSGIKLIL